MIKLIKFIPYHIKGWNGAMDTPLTPDPAPRWKAENKIPNVPIGYMQNVWHKSVKINESVMSVAGEVWTWIYVNVLYLMYCLSMNYAYVYMLGGSKYVQLALWLSKLIKVHWACMWLKNKSARWTNKSYLISLLILFYHCTFSKCKCFIAIHSILTTTVHLWQNLMSYHIKIIIVIIIILFSCKAQTHSICSMCPWQARKERRSILGGICTIEKVSL